MSLLADLLDFFHRILVQDNLIICMNGKHTVMDSVTYLQKEKNNCLRAIKNKCKMLRNSNSVVWTTHATKKQ